MAGEERLKVVVEFAVEGIEEAMKSVGDTFQGFNKTLSEGADEGKYFSRVMSDFRVQLLGVLFFMQAVAGAMGGLLSPAAQSLGIFELWSTMLQIVFLPIMLAVLPLFIDLISYFMNLPDGVKMAIGAFVLFSLILAKLIVIGITMFLGFHNLFSLLGKFPGTFQALGTVFGATAATITAIISLLIIIVIGFFLAWKDNFMNIKKWFGVWIDGIKNAFGGLIKILAGLLMFWVGLFNRDFDMIKEAWKNMWEGMKQTAKGMIQIMAGIVSTIGISILRAILEIINGAIRLVNSFLPGDMKISQISTSRLSEQEKQIKQATNIKVEQNVKIETKSNEADIKKALADQNTALMKVINMNLAGGR